MCADLIMPPASTSSPVEARALPVSDLRIVHAGYRMVHPRGRQAVQASPDWRLFWADRPGPKATSSTWQQTMTPDQAILVPPLLPFQRAWDQTFVTMHLHFRTAWTFVSPLTPQSVPITDPERSQLVTLAQAIVDRRLQDAAIAATGLVTTALAQIDASPGVADARIARLLQAWTVMPPADLPDNDEAAAELGMGVDGFIRRFSRATGYTPGAWRLRQRLAVAARHLRGGDSVSQVASTCGWQSRSRFSKAFRDCFGQAPATWQRRMAEEL